MGSFEILFVAGIVGGLAAWLYILSAKPAAGNAVLAAMLCGGFAAYTAVQIWHDGVIMFWTNHTVNLTGIQVWWDLIISVLIALFFIAPRARKMGMNLWLWAIPVGLLGSVGLLAVIARLFWLENRAAAETAGKAV